MLVAIPNPGESPELDEDDEEDEDDDGANQSDNDDRNQKQMFAWMKRGQGAQGKCCCLNLFIGIRARVGKVR